MAREVEPERESPMPARAEVFAPFFRSKLRPPRVSEHYVRRPRLERLLDDLTRLPVTLVVAGAGSGKTTLAADWVVRRETPTSWLSLDAGDAEPLLMWSSLIGALDRLAPGTGARVMPAVRRGEHVDQVLLALLQHLETPAPDEGPDEGLLVVDNLHLIDDDEVSRRMWSLLVEHAPAWMHVLLLSRHRPPLAVERLGASGRLAEIGFEELALTDRESVAVLSTLSPTMGAKELTAHALRAGGWAAAVQLSALADRARHAVPSLEVPARSDHLLDEYVWHEVLRAEPADVVQVLLGTAAAERVNADLAEAMTGRPDAGDLLAEAERRCLFVSRLSGGWFQVHDLVRQMLRAELERRPSSPLAEQHLRAARWFEDVGENVTAMKHWLDGGRPGETLRLLASSVTELYDSGRQSVIVGLVARIPPTVVGADLSSMQQFALCQLTVSRTGFLETVATLEEYENAEPTLSELTRARSTILRAMASLMTGHWTEGEAQAREAMTALGPGLLDPIGRFGRNLVARGFALTERWRDDDPDVRLLRRGLRLDEDRLRAFEGTRALGLALAGRPVDALRVAGALWRSADMLSLSLLRAEVELAEAVAMSELGDSARAQAKLADLADTPSTPITYAQPLALLALVEQFVREGRADEADRALARAEFLVNETMPGIDGCTALGRAGVLHALADGDARRAETFADLVHDPFWTPVTRARLHLADGDRGAAREALHDAPPRSVRQRVVKGLLEAVTAGDRETALKSVAEAVGTAAGVGLLTTVVAEGEPVRELVELTAWSVPQEWLARYRRMALPALLPPRSLPTPVESLTEREHDVLRMLASRLTVREIAAELYVSENTMKFHLRSIYRKLGVSSRQEAVAAARGR